MSGAKFASITAGLLARKGEAQPWNAFAVPETEKPSLPWRAPPPPVAPIATPQPVPPHVAAAPPPPPPAKERSCAVRMSAHDFERLGILAVKSGVSRQQLLKNALADFLTGKAQDYGCACLGACNRDCTPAG